MTEYTQQPTGQDAPQGQGKPATTPPPAFIPADQPKLPKDNWKEECKASQDGPTVPSIPDPKPCPPTCECPLPPPGSSNCIDDLIRAQTEASAAAESAKSFTSDLEALAVKAKAAQAEYTLDKYKQLLDRWRDADKAIVDLIAKLVCAVPCWRCVIECRVCPLYSSVRNLERRLDGCGKFCATVDSLYDKQYWQTRDRDAKKATLERIKGVLAAWEKPLQTIDKVLTDNATLIASAGKTLAPDAPKLLYDVFMRLVPMHLLIAPPVDITTPETKIATTTGIHKKFTQLCPYDPCNPDNPCDPGKPDDCCGPDMGTPSLVKRLLGPQPYLIPPDTFPALLCCAIVNRYKPAALAYAAAVGALSATENEIKRTKADIDDKIKSIDKDAKTELGKPIDCCKERPKDQPKDKPDKNKDGCEGKDDAKPQDPADNKYSSDSTSAPPARGAAS